MLRDSPYLSTTMEPLAKPKRTKLALFIAALVILIPRMAAAEPVPLYEMPTMHLLLGTGDGRLTGPNGKDYRIPKGSHILTPDAWKENDDAFKLLQDSKTRLTAENKSLRESASEVPMLAISLGIAVGVVGGFYIGYRL